MVYRRMEEELLPQIMMFEELVGGKGFTEGQEKGADGVPKNDLQTFGINAKDDAKQRRRPT